MECASLCVGRDLSPAPTGTRIPTGIITFSLSTLTYDTDYGSFLKSLFFVKTLIFENVIQFRAPAVSFEEINNRTRRSLEHWQSRRVETGAAAQNIFILHNLQVLKMRSLTLLSCKVSLLSVFSTLYLDYKLSKT